MNRILSLLLLLVGCQILDGVNDLGGGYYRVSTNGSLSSIIFNDTGYDGTGIEVIEPRVQGVGFDEHIIIAKRFDAKTKEYEFLMIDKSIKLNVSQCEGRPKQFCDSVIRSSVVFATRDSIRFFDALKIQGIMLKFEK